MTEPVKYYTAKAVRELDRLAIEEHHIPGFELMQRAGNAAYSALRKEWPLATQLIVCCGTGNNGGDGFIIAALARAGGLKVDTWLVGSPASIKGDALKAMDYAQAQQVAIHDASGLSGFNAVSANTVIVDALLGTGLTGEVREGVRKMIDAINSSALPVLAVDIPSGLCSDTGAVLGACVKAAMTVTFIGRKLGLIKGSGPALAGKVVFADLGVPAEIYQKVAASQ